MSYHATKRRTILSSRRQGEKATLLQDSNNIKGETMETGRRPGVSREGEEGVEQRSTEEFEGSETTL